MSLGWVVLGVLYVLTASVALRIDAGAVVALAQDGLAHLLVLAWVVLAAALVGGEHALAIGAVPLAVGHVVLVVPRLVHNRTPHWVAGAPRLDLLVSNVFVDNETPAELARVLLAGNADVIVVAEWNARFVGAFDAAGGRAAYPNRVFDPDDGSDYAVGIVSRAVLGAGSQVLRLGPLTVVRAVVEIDGHPLTILGINPMAAVDPGGFGRWQEQMDELIGFVPSVPGALVVAGDLNATTHRPKIRALLAAGLHDAHESLGRGLSASFKLAATGALAAPGPVARLDHALLNDRVRAVGARDLASAGSDHMPFVVRLAVQGVGQGSPSS